MAFLKYMTAGITNTFLKIINNNMIIGNFESFIGVKQASIISSKDFCYFSKNFSIFDTKIVFVSNIEKFSTSTLIFIFKS